MCSRDGEGTTNGSATLSRVSILVGFICALSYFGAFVGTGWVYTKEPYRLTNLNLYTSVTFKIGLWRACHSFKRINSTITLPMSGCTLINYTTDWTNNELTLQHITIYSDIESTINVISRMRWCAIFVATGFALQLIGFICFVMGHFYRDNKTLMASAIYTLSGLSLAIGLFLLVCVLTDSFAIHTSAFEDEQRTIRHYKYGWCFLVASICCVVAEIKALLCITIHHKRCQTIAQIIKNIIPTEEKQSHVNNSQKSDHWTKNETTYGTTEVEGTSETPPDICSTFLNAEYVGNDHGIVRVQVEQSDENLESCSFKRKKTNYATLNARNYRCLNYPSNLGTKYSTVTRAPCAVRRTIAEESASSSTSDIRGTLPKIRNISTASITGTANIAYNDGALSNKFQAHTFTGEDFDL